MSDRPLVKHGDEQKMVDDPQARPPEDPNSAANDSSIGTVAGTTGPTPLTGAEIVSATTDEPPDLI